MNQVGIEKTVPQLIGLIVFWLLMCVFLMAACNILGLEAVSVAMQNVVAYIPKLIVAAVIVVVGLLLATFLRGLIATSADRVGISYAQQLAAACYYVLALMVLIAAFEQLEIKFELLSQAILIAFGAVAIGFGLAFGLGGREVMGGILAGTTSANGCKLAIAWPSLDSKEPSGMLVLSPRSSKRMRRGCCIGTVSPTCGC